MHITILSLPFTFTSMHIATVYEHTSIKLLHKDFIMSYKYIYMCWRIVYLKAKHILVAN